jgi:serine-type D-Ala-D-Ala carboxypeptidase (penicillin-binding protein 5/6)
VFLMFRLGDYPGRVRRVPLLAAAAALALASPAAGQHQPLVHQDGALATHGLAVTAKGAILIDANDGSVVWGKNERRRLPIASTTKIMTAIVAMERLRPHDVVTVDKSVTRVQPFKEGLRPGEKVEAWKLFYGALLVSGNDTALALAIGAGGTRSKFVALMNEKAKVLGLRDSHFRSPSGLLDRDNYSTAWDMASLTRYAMWNPRFRTVVRTRVKRVPWAAPTYAKIYVNHNHLLGAYPGVDGVKTGWTTLAKHCLVASARRNGVWLIAVVLGSDDMYGDVRKLFDFGFAVRS